MRIVNVVVVVFVLLFSVNLLAAEKPEAPYNEAKKLVESGEYAKAEEQLTKLISANPKNAKYYQLMGDLQNKQGRSEEALKNYEKAKSLHGENPELLKGIATSQKRLRKFHDAEKSYNRAIELAPKDEEAKDDLNNLKLKRGLQFKAFFGGWEPDYTKFAYEGSVFYGGLDRFDLNAGYSYADQTYYTRHKVFANGYYYYNPVSYLKLNLAYKDYNYPVDPSVQKPNPDSNSYDTVPVVEVEVSHWFIKSLRGTLAYEYFRPSFFHDPDAHANNHKISTEVYYITPFEPLRLKVMYALLRDPDPDKTTIKGRSLNMPAGTTASSTNVQYQTQSLLGGGIELSIKKVSAELKYMPNRDLDSSYDYSILAGFGYEFTDKISGRLDYVYDKYSDESTYAGKTANVYMVSGLYKLHPRVDLGAGYKYIDLPTDNQHTGFLSLIFKTGLGF